MLLILFAKRRFAMIDIRAEFKCVLALLGS